MGKLATTVVLGVLIAVGAWEYVRVMQVEKDVLMHHYDRCQGIQIGGKVGDLTRFGDLTIGVADDWETTWERGLEGVQDGHLFVVNGLKKGKIEGKKVEISNFPVGIPFHPRGFYLFENSTLFVLNSAYSPHGTRIELLNITQSGDGVTAKYHSTIGVPKNLDGKVGDLIVTASWEMYLAQESGRKDEGDGAVGMKVGRLVDDLFSSQSAFVHRCTFKPSSSASCSPLNSTAAVSVSGISKDKFGSFFVAYSSIDYNYIGVYERNDKTGDLNLRYKVPIRDKAEKIEWDEGWQRTYGGALPYPYSFSSVPTPGGVIEMKAWDFRGGYVYRSLIMQPGDLLTGATCAVRQGDYFMWGSKRDTKLLVCEIASPGN